MYSRTMFQSKRRVLEVTWERCCDLAWKASRRSLHRDHTSVLARDVQGAKATPNRAKRAPGCPSEKKMTSSIAQEFPMFRSISERVEDVRVHKREKIKAYKREKSGCISDPHAYIHTYIHTYIPTYLHTYIHAYIHTYIHTYVHRNNGEYKIIYVFKTYRTDIRMSH